MNDKQQNYIVAAICAALYILVYALCTLLFRWNSDLETYTAGWVMHNRYLYVWLVAILFGLFGKRITCILTTIGCFLGIYLGDVIGDYIHLKNLELVEQLISKGTDSVQIYFLKYHQSGVYIWLLTILVFMLIGLILDFLTTRRKKKLCFNKGNLPVDNLLG